MTPAEYVEWLFGIGSGVLGWSPADTWQTPIPLILSALRARVDWIRMCRGEPARAPDPAEQLKSQLRALNHR